MPILQTIAALLPGGARIRHPRFPPSLPIAPAVQLIRYVTDSAKLFDEACRKLGPIFTLDLPVHGPIVVFSDDETLRKLFTGSSEDLGTALDITAFFVGPRSIMLLDGKPHEAARSRTASAFSGSRMRSYGPPILEVADQLIDKLKPGMRISAMELGRDVALQVIMRALFGIKSGPESQRIEGLVKNFMDQGHSPVATLLSLCLPPRAVRSIVIGPRDQTTMAPIKSAGLDSLLSRLPAMRAGRDLIDGLLAQIEYRRATLDADPSDALGYLLLTARESGYEYSPAAALDEVLTILLAGHDTTAITLAWALYRLGRSPKVLKRLRAELYEAYGDGPLNPHTVERLPYLAAVLHETMRLDGLGRGISRRLKHDMNLGGYDLPAGTIVIGYTYPAHRDPKRWSFADDFEPEQFLDKRPKSYEFAPFGGGYRRCVGAAIATYEAKIFLAQMVRRTDFAVPQDVTVKIGMHGPTVGPIGPVPLDIR